MGNNNNGNTLLRIFQNAAKDAYNEKMKADGKNDEVVSTFEELIGKNLSFPAVGCKDQYFGIVSFEKNSSCEWETIPVYLNKVNDEEKQRLALDRISKQKEIKNYKPSNTLKTIVIVLESPHTDEFLNDKKGWKAIGPACGTTGENLYKWLPEVLMNYVPCKVDPATATATYNESGTIGSGEYKVKLINAIRYQCSLGCDTVYYRDAVFTKMWKHEAMDVKES